MLFGRNLLQKKRQICWWGLDCTSRCIVNVSSLFCLRGEGLLEVVFGNHVKDIDSLKGDTWVEVDT
jgi:hypothetical protein